MNVRAPLATPSTTLFCGPGSEHLEAGLRDALHDVPTVAFGAVRARTFGDGESCIELEPARCAGVAVIVQGTHPPQDSHLQQLFQLVDAARHGGASEVICAVPYFAYARQDRRFGPGQPASADLVLRLLAAAGCGTVVTFDLHNPCMDVTADIRVVNLCVADVLPEQLDRDWRQVVWVSPDAGGAARARRVAERTGGELVVLQKHKTAAATSYASQDVPVAGKDVIIVDDVCSTGSTLAPLAELLYSNGAASLTYAVTHLLADPDRLRSRLAHRVEIVSSNTVPTTSQRIRIEPSLAGALINILRKESVVYG